MALAPAASLAQRIVTYALGRFLIDVGTSSLRVRHGATPGRSLWETSATAPFLRVGAGRADFAERGNPLGSFFVHDSIAFLASSHTFAVTHSDKWAITIEGDLVGSESDNRFVLTFHAIATDQLQFVVGVRGANAAQINRIYLRFASTPDEAFFGFGAQLTYFNQKGRLIPILVQEHGVGRGAPFVTQLVNFVYDGAGGTPHITEAPAPHYITNTLRSLFLENHEYSTFDMRSAQLVEIKLFASTMTGRILYGETPAALIKTFTSYAGRMRALPDWVHDGAMICVQGGSAKVDALLTKLLDERVPVCGMWVQDWSGTRKTAAGQQVLWNWQLNRALYPQWDAMIERLRDRGLRAFVYMNPFLVQTTVADRAPGAVDLYVQAESRGFFVKQNGKTFVYANSSIRAGMIDLSNPAARAWWKALITREVIGEAKASGWMVDFGEALPFNAELHGSADPHVWHNHYPEAWTGLHREAIDETGNGQDYLLWNRSGFTQSPSVSTALWLGDQLQTWDEFDGIKTAVVGLLSAGISGYSIAHSDIGGFTAANVGNVVKIARSKELLMRWMELNAFTAIFRTHEGLIPAVSAQVDSDAMTLRHFARFARVYKALAPYRKELAAEASATGLPIVRHLFIHYASDQNVIALRYQFLLGSQFLIAPVLDRGATSVRVYLPRGAWTDLWTGEKLEVAHGQWTHRSAPLGRPAVFYVSESEAVKRVAESVRAAASS